MIAGSNSDTIRRQMQHIFRPSLGPLSLSALALCLAVTVCTGTSFAQKKKLKGKPPAPIRSVRKNSARAVQTPATREQDVQLDRLPADPSVDNADISITAHLKARSLRFETVPNPTVEFPGQPARDTVWEAQRENLPTPVEPGVTYRNIGIRLKITSVFRDIDRIVAEALGEIPVTDDANTSQTTSANKSVNGSKGQPANSKPVSTSPPSRERPQ